MSVGHFASLRSEKGRRSLTSSSAMGIKSGSGRGASHSTDSVVTTSGRELSDGIHPPVATYRPS